jgi:cytochrome c peroxidase
MLKKFLFLTFIVFVVGLVSSFILKKRPTPYQFPELFHFPKMPKNPTNPVTLEGVELGRFLFYDSILSRNYTFSCGSCHKQEKAFSNSPTTFSKGIEGNEMIRNTPALFNLAWYPFLFWDGRVSGIEEQIFQPVKAHEEMNLSWKEAASRINKNKFYRTKFRLAFGKQKPDSVLISKAIAQFLRTLLSHESKYDKMIKGDVDFTKEEHEGFVIVNEQTLGDCFHCHNTDAHALGTSLIFSNNGLDKIAKPEDYKDKGYGAITGKLQDYGKFKVPSLRNIAFTAPYMHDGRFKTLEEVLDFYSEGVNVCANIDSKMQYAHQRGVKLNAKQKKQVIAFLNTLTDSVFISNPEFGNPFRKK